MSSALAGRTTEKEARCGPSVSISPNGSFRRNLPFTGVALNDRLWSARVWQLPGSRDPAPDACSSDLIDPTAMLAIMATH